MSTIEFSVEVVESAAKTSPKVNGSFNLFFKINDNIGVKASLVEDIRNGNMDRQSRASEYGLGPEVYGKVDFEYESKTWYGYLTEVVNVFDDETEFEEMFDDADKDALYFELKKLVDFEFSDDHEYNMGYTDDGRLVCIDFDNVFETRTQMFMNFKKQELEHCVVLDSVRL